MPAQPFHYIAELVPLPVSLLTTLGGLGRILNRNKAPASQHVRRPYVIEGQETDRRSLEISVHECDFLVKSLGDVGACATSTFGLLPGSGEYPSGSRILIIP